LNGGVIFHWQVSHSEAREKCANKNMSLLSTETPAEKDALVALFGEKFIEIKNSLQFSNRINYGDVLDVIEQNQLERVFLAERSRKPLN
jgi:hypothetical protein